MTSEHAKASEAVEYLRRYVSEAPKVGVICGSGLGGFADSLEAAERVATREVPHFAPSTVEGHAGVLVFGRLRGSATRVVAVQGRLHTYEGHPIQSTVFVVRILALLGVKTLVVTNAAGGINPQFSVGDLMVISDHINLPGMAGVNPLRGPNEAGFGGPRFLATNNVYAHRLRHLLFTIADAAQLDRQVHEGVYTYLTGPTYESAAEIRMLQMLGTDAVGMSTVPEAIAAQHSGMEVLGLSLITNAAIGEAPRSGRLPPLEGSATEPSHAEVIEEARHAAKDVQYLVSELIRRLDA